MKRSFTLIALLGLVIGTMLTGCNKSADTGSTTSEPATNAAPSTNK